MCLAAATQPLALGRAVAVPQGRIHGIQRMAPARTSIGLPGCGLITAAWQRLAAATPRSRVGLPRGQPGNFARSQPGVWMRVRRWLDHQHCGTCIAGVLTEQWLTGVTGAAMDFRGQREAGQQREPNEASGYAHVPSLESAIFDPVHYTR